MIKWGRSKERRALLPSVKRKGMPLWKRFRLAKRDSDLLDNVTMKNEVKIQSALDLTLGDDDSLEGKAGYILVVNDDEDGFTLAAP